MKDRQIEYDLKYLLAVLAWAAGAEEGKAHQIGKHPWSRERRRAQEMVMPYERNPTRESMTEERHELLLTHSPSWWFTGVMELCRETLHRRDSVRRIAWADVHLARAEIQWRAEPDKNGIEVVTPLSGAGAPQSAAGARKPVGVPGRDRSAAAVVRNDVLNLWLQRAKKRAGLGDVKGLGFHRQKRAGVKNPEFRALPGPIRRKLTGTDERTLDRIYDDPSLEEMRAAPREGTGAGPAPRLTRS